MCALKSPTVPEADGWLAIDSDVFSARHIVRFGGYRIRAEPRRSIDYRICRRLQRVLGLRLSSWVRCAILGMAGRRRGEHVVPHEIVNHQIHLVWNFKLVQVAGADRLAVDHVRQPLRHEMRRI
jgi:hypothetical protein